MIATPENMAACGVGVQHHFGGRAYIKEVHMPAGSFLAQHAHDHDHLSVLVAGTVRLTTDGVGRDVQGYQTLLLEAGKTHGLQALTDVTWLCVWGTDCADAAEVDRVILKGA